MILDQTPFYAESGGQVGDKGEVKGAGFSFAVSDTQKYGQAIGHIGKVASGTLKVGDAVQADVDEARRQRIRQPPATHLMHSGAAPGARHPCGAERFAGQDKALRFDFSHFEAMKPEEIRGKTSSTRRSVVTWLSKPTLWISMPRASGAMALFGENTTIACAFCGWRLLHGAVRRTHAARTGDIGLFRITSESGTAAGVRRIEAVTGEGAMAILHAQSDQLNDISSAAEG